MTRLRVVSLAAGFGALVATAGCATGGPELQTGDGRSRTSNGRADDATRSTSRFGLWMDSVRACRTTHADDGLARATCIDRANESASSAIDVGIGVAEGLDWDDIEPTVRLMRRTMLEHRDARIALGHEASAHDEISERIVDVLARFSTLVDHMDHALDAYETPYEGIIEAAAPGCVETPTYDAEAPNANPVSDCVAEALDARTPAALANDLSMLCQHLAWSRSQPDDAQARDADLCSATLLSHLILDAR